MYDRNNSTVQRLVNNMGVCHMSTLYINEDHALSTISPEIYGHFSEHLGRCIYGGLYVGEDSPIPNTAGMRNDVVSALREMKLPVLRWPGGCFADEYHWQDGIGPKDSRKKMINTNWGGVVEDNSFGTHEYMELCRQIGCKTYVNGNVGSGTVREMEEWVEYMTFAGTSPMSVEREANGHKDPWKLDYFCVGNESWGCGGNMRPDYYADEYRRYQTFLHVYDREHPFKRLAVGPSDFNYDWTDRVMELAGRMMDGLTLHYYTVPGDSWEHKGGATGFTPEVYYDTLYKANRMEELVTRHGEIMDRYDPEKRVALVVDEWGTWYDVEPGTNPGFLYQQNTMRDALVAGITLNIFNRHSDRVRMANIAQLINVLQAVILTDGDRMILTPTYHVFHMYRHHQGAKLLDAYLADAPDVRDIELTLPEVTQSVSIDPEGVVTATLCNLSLKDTAQVDLRFAHSKPHFIEGRVLAGAMDAHNTFEQPESVHETAFTDYTETPAGLNVKLAPCSVTAVRMSL